MKYKESYLNDTETIVKCNKQDSLGRVCETFRWRTHGECKESLCTNLAIKHIYTKGERSKETIEWIKRHNKKLYEQIKDD